MSRISTFILTTSIFLLASCTVNFSRHSWTSPRFEIAAEETGAALSGKWEADMRSFDDSPLQSGSWVSLEIKNEQANERYHYGRAIRDFEGMDAAVRGTGEPLHFTYQNEAGEVILSGARGGRRATGDFQFNATSNYRSEITTLLGAPPSTWELLGLCLTDVSLEYARLTARELPGVQPGELLRLKHRGVSTEYIQGMKAAGITRIDDLARLKQRGVPVELPQQLKVCGYSFSSDEIVKLRNYGVTAEYAAAWKEGDYSLSVDELVRLKNYGVQQDFAAELKALDIKWSVDEIVRARNFGITPDYIQKWKEAGYSLKSDELIHLKRHGVSTEYAAALNVPGRDPVPPETIVELRRRGISPELAKKLRE